MGRSGNMGFFRVNQPEPMAVIAGTFCLMSCSMQSGTGMYIGKLIDNFNYLAECDALDDRFRTICRRMACHWESEQMARRQQMEDGCPVCAAEGMTPLQFAAAVSNEPAAQSTQLSQDAAAQLAAELLSHIAANRALPRGEMPGRQT